MDELERVEGGEVGRGQGQKGAAALEKAVGDQRVDVRMGVDRTAEGLDRRDHAGKSVVAREVRLVEQPDRAVGAAGQQRQELAVALEESAQRAGNGEDEVAVRDARQDLGLGLAGDQGVGYDDLEFRYRPGSTLTARYLQPRKP